MEKKEEMTGADDEKEKDLSSDGAEHMVKSHIMDEDSEVYKKTKNYMMDEMMQKETTVGSDGEREKYYGSDGVKHTVKSHIEDEIIDEDSEQEKEEVTDGEGIKIEGLEDIMKYLPGNLGVKFDGDGIKIEGMEDIFKSFVGNMEGGGDG